MKGKSWKEIVDRLEEIDKELEVMQDKKYATLSLLIEKSKKQIVKKVKELLPNSKISFRVDNYLETVVVDVQDSLPYEKGRDILWSKEMHDFLDDADSYVHLSYEQEVGK